MRDCLTQRVPVTFQRHFSPKTRVIRTINHYLDLYVIYNVNMSL